MLDVSYMTMQQGATIEVVRTLAFTTLGLLLTLLFVPDARQLFGFAPVSSSALGWCLLAALVGVGWIEGYKAIKKRN